MNDFVAYLNSTNNIGGNSTGSLAESQVKSPFYDSVKVDRKIGNRIVTEINSGIYQTYILTGHAGDGKTSILVQVLKALDLLNDGEGLEFSKEYPELYYVKDMSEIPESRQVELLEKSLQAPNNRKTGILISNTGPLLRAFLTLAKEKAICNGSTFSDKEKIELQSKILNQLDKNEDKPISIAGYDFILINIARIDNVTFATKILRKILAPELWEACSSCDSCTFCPILMNQKLLSAQVDRVCDFVDNYYRYLYENDKRMTIRQMVGQLSYGITGNLTCEKIENNLLKSPFFTYNFANLFFGHKGLSLDSNSKQIKGIDYINNVGLDKVALSADYRLFVNHDYSFFSQEIQDILEKLSTSTRKHFQIMKEAAVGIGGQYEKTARVRRAIRRFYLVFGMEQDGFPVSEIYNQIYGKNYMDYKKIITSSQPSSLFRKLQTVVFNALYIKNTGFLPASSSEMILPLTLRREDEVYQSVLLMLGKVHKSDIRVVAEKISSDLEDEDDKYNIFIQLGDERFRLSLAMLNYFNNLIDGAVTSNNNPALSHGIASLDTLLLKKYGEAKSSQEDDYEISIIVNTTKGQKIKKFDFVGRNLYLED